MAHDMPSIQSFYKSELRPSQTVHPIPEPTKSGDGFSEDEVAAALDPLHRKWNPEREYDESSISQLIPGPRAVTFVGRIVNLKTVAGRCAQQPKASGFHALIVKDDSAAISIKLYFARSPYCLKLGQLLSIWTVFISDTTKMDVPQIPSVIVHANLFPGRVTSDHVIIHTSNGGDAICRTPLDYQNGQPLHGLMTLDSYLSSGHDGVTGAKILVCVKSFGGKKKISRKDGGGESELLDLTVFDHTGEVRLTVWNEKIESAMSWIAGQTVLLITSPGYRVGFLGKGNLGFVNSTMVDVEPEFADAEWLRKYAVDLMKKEGLYVEFPQGVWDIEATEYGVNRMLFTLAELDRWVRSDGNQVFSGFINVTIMEMNLVTIHRRSMLTCANCCGIIVYANTLTTHCRNCDKVLCLSLNPRIIGLLVDETGCIATGKLLWSTRAWEKFFGRTVGEVLLMSSEQMRLFEQRALFMRLHLVFGWEEGVGRLAVLGVMS